MKDRRFILALVMHIFSGHFQCHRAREHDHSLHSSAYHCRYCSEILAILSVLSSRKKRSKGYSNYSKLNFVFFLLGVSRFLLCSAVGHVLICRIGTNNVCMRTINLLILKILVREEQMRKKSHFPLAPKGRNDLVWL